MAASEPELTAQRMLLELDLPAGEDDRRAIVKAFGVALDPIRRMLIGGLETSAKADVYQRFGIVHLLARSLSDLLAGGHLASHYYLSQAYNALRPVLESCDLIDLFASEPGKAEQWATTENAHRDFRPADVRALLGKHRYDPMYGHVSEAGSHPRFLGAQMSGGFTVDPRNREDRTAMFRVGPMWPEHPATLTIWPFAFWLATATASSAVHLIPLTTDPRAAERCWAREFLECVEASKSGTALAVALLPAPPEFDPFEEFENIRSTVLAHLDSLGP